ncbi:MAG: Wzz/FepE/Etk N-terminal domain-containing protein [Desulfobacterales bacterium]|nr:Wzz/FepE/Etk N-terminal domain-containing protein [Desulfobacterales bacterium]
MDQRMDQLDDEIKLMDCLKVIWKWKKLIILGTIVIVIVAGVISFLMPKVYSIQMVLEPGILKVSEDDQNIYAESQKNIKALIETGVFDRDILKSLKVPNRGHIPKFLHYKVTVPIGSNAIIISYQTPDVNLGVDILKKLSELLQNRHSQLGIRYKNKLMIEIQAKKTEVPNLVAEKEASKQMIKNMDKRISGLVSEISDMKKNTKSLIKERNQLVLKGNNKQDILSIILYANILQQDLTFTSILNNDLEQLVLKRDEEKVYVENLKNKIAILDQEIKSMDYKKMHIQNIQIIQPPTRNPYPIRPKIKLNVTLATLVGLFVMLLLAFFLEYIQRHRD